MNAQKIQPKLRLILESIWIWWSFRRLVESRPRRTPSAGGDGRMAAQTLRCTSTNWIRQFNFNQGYNGVNMAVLMPHWALRKITKKTLQLPARRPLCNWIEPSHLIDWRWRLMAAVTTRAGVWAGPSSLNGGRNCLCWLVAPPCPTRDLIGYRYQKALRRRNRIDVALAQANGVLRLSPVAAG